MRLMSTPTRPGEAPAPNPPPPPIIAARFPSIRTRDSSGSKPRRLGMTLPFPPARPLAFWLMVEPIDCGSLVSRSVELRAPNFSMASGRYVSTGFGPASSAVGICEPVTTTRSASASVGIPGVGEGFCAETEQASKANNPATEEETKCPGSRRRIEFLRVIFCDSAWILFGACRFLWCERGDDFLEARIAAQRVPEWAQAQAAISVGTRGLR